MSKGDTNMGVFRPILYFCAAAVTLAAAGLPYAGKWKMNPAKSDFGQSTVAYTQLPSGEIEATEEGQTYKFRMDGKDYTTPYGETAAWKPIDANTWEVTEKVNGKSLGVTTLSLSTDGKTLTAHSKGVKPNGEAMDDTVVYDRISGSAGLMGKWKTKNLKSNSPETLELTPSANGLVYNLVDFKMTCDAKMDGKYYPCTGPALAPGWTLAWVKNDAKGLEWSVQRNGKAMFHGVLTVSADGKTLTETESPAGTAETIKIVYDRQ